MPPEFMNIWQPDNYTSLYIHLRMPDNGQTLRTKRNFPIPAITNKWAGLVWAEVRNGPRGHAFLFVSQPRGEHYVFW